MLAIVLIIIPLVLVIVFVLSVVFKKDIEKQISVFVKSITFIDVNKISMYESKINYKCIFITQNDLVL